MKPNYEEAAASAMRVLALHGISTVPISPLPIVKSTPGVLAMPFAELASNAGVDRHQFVPMFGSNQDAVTFYIGIEGVDYVVAYNQYLPMDVIRRGLARELGHIVLGHNGSRLPTDVRMEEAMCFARHLLFPRPVLHAIQESGVPFTVEVLGSVTGCYQRCLDGLQKTPGVRVPPELNRAVKRNLQPCIDNFIAFQRSVSGGDRTPLADFGPFMDGYEE